MKKRTLLITFMLLTFFMVKAAYFEKLPYTIFQPNGDTINCFVTGDEYFNWIHDDEGFTIIQASNGYYYYAEKNGDKIVPSIYLVNTVDPESVGLSKWVKISTEEYILKRDAMYAYQKESGNHSPKAPHSGMLNNLVVYLRFSDDAEFATTRQTYDDKFNPATGVSLKSYFTEVSYNNLTINSTHYPACALTTNLSYQDTHPRAYFQPYNATTNPTGYNGDTERRVREHQLLVDAITWINANSPVSASLNIDGDGDNEVDNVCFIVKGNSGGWAELLWAHRWALYSQTVYINGKRVYDYTFQPENQVGVTTLCHEMFHALGSPDLYHYTSNGIAPVSSWDLMESGSGHMTAYMKWKYTGNTWITSIPQITTNGTYSLNPLTSSTNNCYKIASPNSVNEYFVVEYRYKSGTFESNIPGSGLIVYRINTLTTGNASGPPDEVYIYRPGGTTTANGTTSTAFFSSTVGRTAINDATNPSSFLQNGSAGGLNISNVTSAGATISFTVTFQAPCTPPTIQAYNYAASSIANNSMTAGWNRGNGTGGVLVIAKAGSAVDATPLNGTAYTANAVFGSGTQLGTGNYVVYNGSGTSVNITGLAEGTSYYFAIYEYTSGSNCYKTPALIGSAATGGYCPAGSTATTYEYISNFAMGSINQASGRGAGGYENYTSQNTTMQIGVNTTATITVTNPYSTDQILIWIDWNKDNDFTDSGENVYSSSGSSFTSPHITTNFAAPSGAAIGTTRMRVRMHDSGAGPNATPCGTSTYGEVEDYSINVIQNCTPPGAPVIGNITQPSCTVSTGSVVLSGLPASGTWTLTRSPGDITSTGTGTSSTISGLAADTYSYTVTNASGCTSTASANIVINSQPSTPSAPIIGTITQPTCTEATGSVMLNGLPATGNWTLTSTPGGITSAGTGTTSTFLGLTASYTYSFTVTNAEGCTSTGSGSVVINSQPLFPSVPSIGTITQPTCSGAFGSVILNDLPASGNWTLTRSPGGITTTGSGTSSIISGLTTGTYTYTVTGTNGCESLASDNVVIISQPRIPVPAGVITGQTVVCQGEDSVDYSVPTIGLATSYIWTFPTGATGISTTNSIKVSFGVSALSGNITVRGTNSCGDGTASIKAITVNRLPTNAGTISGPVDVCPGQDSLNYSVPTIAYATSYVWTLPAGATGISTTKNINVNFGDYALSGSISVYGHNSCGDGINRSMEINIKPRIPVQAGTISGPVIVCQGEDSVNYSVPSIGLATSYLWTFPSGATGTSLTNSIKVNYGVSAISGNITVRGTNFCGDGPPSTLAITVNRLPTNAGEISGPADVCQGQNSLNYSVPTIAFATSYVWNLPPGVTGTSTTKNIVTNYGTSSISGNISVYGNNSCGNGASKSLTISVSPKPSDAGIISGLSSVCQQQNSLTYFVPAIANASAYIWSLPGGVSGYSNADSITLNYGPYALPGNITVKGNNTCGEGNPSSLGVIVNPAYTFLEYDSICSGESYIWQGTNYSTSGIYTSNHPSIFGCDSNYTLFLTVKPDYAFTESETLCEGNTYLWHGQSLTKEGIYQDIYKSAGGCDSIYTLNLKVNPAYNIIEDNSICNGDTLNWHGQRLTAGGVYTSIYQTVNGCDSTHILHLSINPDGRSLQLRVFLEGLYTGNGMMNQAKSISGPKFGPDIADIVSIELHEDSPPYDIRYEQNNISLLTNGMIIISDIPCNIGGEYYLVVKHRNSIETWSNAPVYFGSASPIDYDFSSSASKAFGNNLTVFGIVYAIWGGDNNQDGVVDGTDMATADNASTPPALQGYYPEDVNGDGIVDGSDMAMIDNNSAPPPVQVIRP